MSAARTFTITLTEAQHEAVQAACDYYETVIDDDPARYPGRRLALDNGSAILGAGWHRAGLKIDDYHVGWVRGLVEMYGVDAVRRTVEREAGR